MRSARPAVTSLLMAAIALSLPNAAMAANVIGSQVPENVLARTFLFVDQALVYIVGDGGYGSGFVVGRDRKDKLTYILTAAHVVCPPTKNIVDCSNGAQADVYLNDNLSDKHSATVIWAEREAEPGVSATSGRPDLDLALLELDGVGNIQPLYVPLEAREGTEIAVAGYPVSSQLARNLYGELRPTLHEGVVSAVRLRGMVIEHSAVTDEGNSGGPLFDANTGYVLGIVEGKLLGASGAYQTTGFLAIHSFLERHRNGENSKHRHFDLPPPNIPRFPYQVASGRSRLLLASALTVRPEWRAYRSSENTLLQRLQSRVFSSPAVTDPSTRVKFISAPISAFTFDPAETFAIDSPPLPDLSGVCGSRAVGVLYFNPALAKQRDGTQRLSVNLALLSCHGNVLRYFSDTRSIGRGAKPRAIRQALNSLVAPAVEHFREGVEREPTRYRNFLLYGWFLADGEWSALFDFDIHPENHQVYVNIIDPQGTAYRSGLRLYDTVVSINGHSTAHHTLEMLDYEEESYWVLGVDRPDMPTQTICFPAENLGWYLDHAAGTGAHLKCQDALPSATPAPVVDNNPVVVQGDAVLSAGSANVDLTNTVTFRGYMVSATDTTNPDRGVRVSHQTAAGFTLSGATGDTVHWIAVGTLSPQQSYHGRQP